MKWNSRPLILAALGTFLTAMSAMAQNAPVADDQTLTTFEDTAKAITLLATDLEGDPLTYEVLSLPTHGTLTGTPPDLTYQPMADYSGPDSFAFLANDGIADSNIATVSISVTPVNDAPTGTVMINAGKAAVTRSTQVLLTLTAADDSGGAIMMCISNTPTCGSWAQFETTKSWTLASGNGWKTVNVWFRDMFGKTTPLNRPFRDTILLDTQAPANGNITVAQGYRKLTLNWNGFTDNIPGSGITSYRAVFQTGSSAPLSCTAGTPVPGYAGTATTLVHSGLINGTTYGYRVCAIDAAGNMSSGAAASGNPVSDPPPPTDTTAPTDGTVTVAAGVTQQLNLSWSGFTDTGGSGITGYQARFQAGTVAPSSCIAGTTVPGYISPAVTLVHAGLVNGTTYAYRICAVDAAGNVSAGAAATGKAVPETTPPTGTVLINNGAAATQSAAAVLTLTLNPGDAEDGAIEMCISDTASCNAWTAFAGTKSWTLLFGDATNSVFVWYRDQWGNTTPTATPFTDTIFLDTTAPTDGTVTATPGYTQLTLNWSGFTDTAGSGVTGYQAFFQEGSVPASCSGTAVPGYAGTATTLVHTGLVNGTIYGYRVCAIDAADNISSGASASGHPVSSGCEICHGQGGSVHPGIDGVPGTADDAPNVMTYWDGSWWDTNKGGSSAKQQGGHGDPDNLAAGVCLDCHDIALPNPSTHLDGTYNSIWGNSSGTRNSNTSHLRASFIGGAAPAWSVQLTLDTACWGCHNTIGGIQDMRHERDGNPAAGVLLFGTHLSRSNGDTLPIPVLDPADSYDVLLPGPYPVDQDISTNASGSSYYAPCVSCHDPHGTSARAKTTEPNSTNFMLRDNWVKPSLLCKVCHP